MIFKFRSSSQVFVNVVTGCCTKTIKFGILAEGGSYYNTCDESIARQIRACKMFRIGRITEFAPEAEKSPVAPTHIETRKLEPEAVKTKLTGKRTYMRQPSATVINDIPQRANDVRPEGNASGTVEETATEHTGINDSDGGVQLSSVTSYMEAKTYLRNVLHVDAQQIGTKAKTQEYCQHHGIKFPNYEF